MFTDIFNFVYRKSSVFKLYEIEKKLDNPYVFRACRNRDVNISDNIRHVTTNHILMFYISDMDYPALVLEWVSKCDNHALTL